ncbi:MAG: hypothetical protein DA329_09170 [Candidatus Nitrosocosmicus sp.]|nr:hypothetical protein [Candidatus Nitrosocosmicus sp.]
MLINPIHFSVHESVRVWISSSINQEKNDNPKQYSSYEKLLLLMNSVTSLEDCKGLEGLNASFFLKRAIELLNSVLN